MGGEYRQLMDSFWRWRLEESPEFASMCGTHGAFDGKLDSWDLPAFEARKEAAESFLAQGRRLLSDASSSSVDGGGKSIPQFRQTLEDRLYTIVPSRFPIHSAYAEGWALYCESLGIEMGVYDGDLYALHAKYQFEILRSARLVVDTGLHWMGWSKERAVRYLVDNTALSLANIEFEVNRYITWPGQACAYKIGELAIKDMRKRAGERLGGSFDLRQFHKCILQTGFVPLSVLKEKVDNWVDERAKGLPKNPCPC